MRISVMLLALTIASVAYGTLPPPPEPIKEAFRRFEEFHIPQCERLLSQLRSRLSRAEIDRHKQAFDGLDRYLSNMRHDDVYGLRRAIEDQASSAIPYWSARTVTDIVGFRRVVDQVIVEALASGALKADDHFLEVLRAFWESERAHAWRFSREADPARP